MVTKLPERYRLARNLDKGFEIHANCGEHDGGHWLPITHALHILSPLKVSRFTLDAPDCIADCREYGDFSDTQLLSRRQAS